MFTGLIESIGKINSIIKKGNSKIFEISTTGFLKDIKIGDSIAIDGVCQTVTKIVRNRFSFTSVEETLRVTKFDTLRIGYFVNLEKALKADSRLGGHYVLGHIDTTAKIESLRKEGNNWLLSFSLPEDKIIYVAQKGSIAIDGISLTVSKIEKNKVFISIIPHTYDSTTLKYKKANSLINIEFDILTKHLVDVLRRDKK